MNKVKDRTSLSNVRSFFAGISEGLRDLPDFLMYCSKPSPESKVTLARIKAAIKEAFDNLRNLSQQNIRN